MNRAERRRQLREEEKRVARGLDARQIDGRQMVALMRALDQKLQVSVQRGSVGPLMEFLYANMSSGARFLKEVPIACGRGCSHCCHSWVDATAVEALFAVKSMTRDQRPRAIEAVGRVRHQTAGKSFDERSAMVTPCPLLDGHVCSVYSARPIVCRAAVSADADTCRRAYLEMSGEGVPVPAVWRNLGKAYAVGLEGAILHAGLVPTVREWNDSIWIALNDVSAEARWLAGEDVFGALPRVSTSRTFDNPHFGAMYLEAFNTPPP